eukprot:scaffold222_cov176-Ochromonas_danica.AAC.5
MARLAWQIAKSMASSKTLTAGRETESCTLVRYPARGFRQKRRGLVTTAGSSLRSAKVGRGRTILRTISSHVSSLYSRDPVGLPRMMSEEVFFSSCDRKRSVAPLYFLKEVKRGNTTFSVADAKDDLSKHGLLLTLSDLSDEKPEGRTI